MNSRVAPIDLVSLVSLAGAAVDGRVIDALEAAGYHGLRARHGYVIQRLLVAPSSVTRLAEDIEVSQQAMSKTVADLHARGIVTLERSARDARRRTVALSARGHAAVDHARRARAAIQVAWREEVGPEALDAAAEVLTGLLHRLGLSDRLHERRVPQPRADT